MHSFAGWQEPPLEQDAQFPPLQTLPVPHGVPLALFVVSLQTDEPLLQLVAPFLHGLLGLHVVPEVQEPQLPLLHTLFGPQLVPLPTLPLSTQTGEPEEHSVKPSLHGFDGAQLWPCAHTLQVPRPSQTMPWPQEIPGGDSPVSLQLGAPPLQSTVAVAHTLEAAQLAPWAQSTHLPFGSQTLLVAQAVQVTLPPQPSDQVPHSLPRSAQDFAAHLHAPCPSHFCPTPQLVPLGALPSSVHTPPPLLQSMLAVLQALLAWQAAPSRQSVHLPL